MDGFTKVDPHLIEDEEIGTLVKLDFGEGGLWVGTYQGIDSDEEIMLKVEGSEQVIGLPLIRLIKYYKAYEDRAES